MKVKLVAAIALALSATPACAGWQHTNWGMTPEQVVAASKGGAKLGVGEDGDRIKDGPLVGAVGTYESGKYRFRSVYYFDGGKLSLVMLKLLNGSSGCGTLWADLKSVYGNPNPDPSPSRYFKDAIWHDKGKNNFVALLEIGDLCSLSYKPLKSEDNAGL